MVKKTQRIKPLDRKLLRNLWEMKGQVLAIALVIACGIATFVMSLSTLDSLEATRSSFYRTCRFAQVFASLKRAPERVAALIQEIPGVEQVETRIVAQVRLEIDGFAEPVRGLLVSIPDTGQPVLNNLFLRQGRLISPDAGNEVVVSEAFAEAQGLQPGDRISAVINGRYKTLTIVGTALSPEYIYQIAPGTMFPDFKRYGILWMNRSALSAAYDMEGAFNDVVLTLPAKARLKEVIDRLDRLLAPYGGLGAYGREDQISHRYLSEELRQLSQTATVLPAIFLGVAVFLLNVVINRLISTQREDIATLKAFGYRNRAVGLHYLKMVMAILLVGLLAGTGLGIWMGKGMSNLYREFYRFPFLKYSLRPSIVIIAGLVSAAAAFIGTLHAVRKAVILPPAEAMRPAAPITYRETFIERLGLKNLLSQPSRMIVRQIERRPTRAILSVAGIACACAILILGTFSQGSIDFMVDVQFGLSQREHLTVTFTEPAATKSLNELKTLDGVYYGETFRSVPVRLRFQHRSYRTAIEGIEPGGDLHRLLDTNLKPVRLPPAGVVLTDYLGKILGVRPGDLITVEVLEGARPVLEVPVAGLVQQYMGISAYMERTALNRLMHEGDVISGAYLAIDTRYQSDIYTALNKMPRIAGTVIRGQAIQDFYETMGKTIFIFIFFITLFAGAIAFGVIYNDARITLSERNRELASLRVLGFTRGEVSYILLGELGLLTLAAIPLGFVLGRGFCAYLISRTESDLFRIPLVIEPRVYAFAAIVVLASAVISGMIVRRKLNRLDLIGVLKTRE